MYGQFRQPSDQEIFSQTLRARRCAAGEEEEMDFPPFTLEVPREERRALRTGKSKHLQLYQYRHAFRKKVLARKEKAKSGVPGWYFWQKYRKRHIVLYDDGREIEEERRKHPLLFENYEKYLDTRLAWLGHLNQLRLEVKADRQLKDPNFQTHYVPGWQRFSMDEIIDICTTREVEEGEKFVSGMSAKGLKLLREIDSQFDTFARYTDDFDLLEGAWFNKGKR